MSQSMRQGSSKWTLAAIALASPPLALAIGLAIINPKYLGSIFDAGMAYGLAMLGVLAVLMAGGYIAMLVSFRVSASGRYIVGTALGVLTTLLCVLPAMLLLVLGPASAQIARVFSVTPVP